MPVESLYVGNQCGYHGLPLPWFMSSRLFNKVMNYLVLILMQQTFIQLKYVPMHQQNFDYPQKLVQVN